MNSQSITPIICSHELINKHEQFYLNYSTEHIFSQKYFLNTIHVNSETLGLLFTAKHPIIGSLCEPEFHGHFRPHAHHNIIHSINSNTSNPKQSVDSHVLSKWVSKFPHLGSKIWDRSNGRSRPQTNLIINKTLK